MFKKESRLGAREAFAMIILMVGVKISNTTPALFAQYGANAFWMMPVFSLLVILPSALLLYYLLKRYENKNLVELTEQIVGKVVGKILCLLLFFIFFFMMAVEGRSYTEQLSLLYFPETSVTFLLFVFFLIIFYGAKRGIETIGTTSWLFLFFIKASVLLLVCIALQEAVFQRVFPLFGNGLDILMIEGAKKASLFTDLFIITMAYPLFKKGRFSKGIFFGFTFVFFEMILFFLLYCTIFDYKSIDKVIFPFHDIAQYINLGVYFTNIETFFMIFWILAAFIKYMIYLNFSSWIFGAVFNIKEFEPLILPFAFFSVVLAVIPEDAIINEFIFKSRLMDFSTPLLVFFPILLWVVAMFKGELKRS